MNTNGFYKKDNQEILFAPNIVEGPDYILLIQNYTEYTYPVEGWIYATSLDDAIQRFAATPTVSPDFHLLPENIYLATGNEDEIEFNKLATLIGLAISQNQLSELTPLSIKDSSKNVHSIPAGRILEIIVQYGMFCYTLRNL